MFTGEAIVEGLEEPADLVLIGFCPREYYYCLAKIEGRACWRFFIRKFIIFGNIPWNLLGEKIPLQTLMHMGVQPHIDEPPRTSEILGEEGDKWNSRGIGQGESHSIGQQFGCSKIDASWPYRSAAEDKFV